LHFPKLVEIETKPLIFMEILGELVGLVLAVRRDPLQPDAANHIVAIALQMQITNGMISIGGGQQGCREGCASRA